MAKRYMPSPESGPMQYTATTTNVVIEQGIVANCTRLNVRERPRRGADVVLVLDEDDVVELLIHKSTNNWYYVKTESGAEGYCMKDYIVRNK